MNINKIAYEQGCMAKANGWDRISPYSNAQKLYWLAGYDGVPYKQVKQFAGMNLKEADE